MKKKIPSKSIDVLNDRPKSEYPTYTSDFMNYSNRYSHATRKENVGNMSQLFPQFLKESEDKSLESWKKWYLDKHPDVIEEATNKAYTKLQQMVEAVLKIDRELVGRYVEDLIIDKTYYGLYHQKTILAYLAKLSKMSYRLATPEEESKGIDGYVGDTAYSVKPVSYKNMTHLQEKIPVKMVYYVKTSDGLEIEIEEDPY